MLENALNEFNPHGIMPALAARSISEKPNVYKIIAEFNSIVFDAASKGLSSTKYEIIRSPSYAECKTYQLNETIVSFLTDCKNRGYSLHYMIGQDLKQNKYFGELIISWKDKTKQ